MTHVVGWWGRIGSSGRRAILVGGVLLAVLAVVAAVLVVTGGDDDEPVDEPSAGVTTTTEPATGPVAPLTGLRLADGAKATRPALVVKIDNLDTSGETALPQAGLSKADIVFEELVEGDITRLVAVFQSQDPGRVGPVRSARTTDVMLLPQLGRPLLAWSGGNEGVVAAVRASPAIIDLGFDAASAAYSRDGTRRAPHNLFVEANQLWDLAGDAPAPEPIFTYRREQPADGAGGEAAVGVDISWGSGPSTSPVAWDWDPDLKLYGRSQSGRPHVEADGSRYVAQNVVVLVTPYGQSPADSRSPEALTIGEGDVLVFTDGQVIRGRWSRPSQDQPAVLTDPDGAEIALTPGQTWIELAPAGAASVR